MQKLKVAKKTRHGRALEACTTVKCLKTVLPVQRTQGRRHKGCGGRNPPKYSACRQICSIPIVLVDGGTRRKRSLSANLV